MYYFTGFMEEPMERLIATLVPQDGTPEFIVPAFYREHVRAASWIPEVLTWAEAADPIRLLHQRLRRCVPARGTIAIDSRMWAQFLLPLLRRAAEWQLQNAQRLIAPLRMRKSSEELTTLRRAFRATDRVMVEAIRYCKAGAAERDVQAVIVERLRREGAQGLSFTPTVATGPNAAMPHYHGGPARFRVGQAVVIDFGGRYEGYCTDITRTVFIERCSPEMRRVYRLVDDANRRGYDAARPGTPAETVDRAARTYLARAGMARYFTHRTGHGLGLEVHEEPYLVEGSRTRLGAGMVFSVEPGVYVPHRYGVRIEDIVALTDQGPERLTQSSHELSIV
jgi:Xaa-Pro dipeptidase